MELRARHVGLAFGVLAAFAAALVLSWQRGGRSAVPARPPETVRGTSESVSELVPGPAQSVEVVLERLGAE